MSATESELLKATETPVEEPKEETPAERLEREMTSLQQSGVIKKQVISRSTFDALSPKTQMNFIRDGGTLENDPAPAKGPIPLGSIRRSVFDALSPARQMDFITRGGTLVDDESVAD